MKKESEDYQNQKSEYDEKIKTLSSQLFELQNENNKLNLELNNNKERYNKDIEILRQSITTSKDDNSTSNNNSVSNEQIITLKKLNKSYKQEKNRLLADLTQLKKTKSDMYINNNIYYI